eukprot:272724-Prymnesium_polylepis.3
MTLPRGFNGTSCGTDAMWFGPKDASAVLPHTSAWSLATSQPVSSELPNGGRACTIRVAIKRDWTRFFLTRMLTNLLVVLG